MNTQRSATLSREAVAFHEAAHAVAHTGLDGGITCIALERGHNPQGFVAPLRRHLNKTLVDRLLRARASGERERIRIAERDCRAVFWANVAGPVAEKRYVGRSHDNGFSAPDMKAAALMAGWLAYPEKHAALFWREWRAVERFVRAHWQHITAVAEALLRARSCGLHGWKVRRLLSALPPIRIPKSLRSA